jgi:hypothetical protein
MEHRLGVLIANDHAPSITGHRWSVIDITFAPSLRSEGQRIHGVRHVFGSLKKAVGLR